MNGFDLKEQIDLAKKRIKEVEREISRCGNIEYEERDLIQSNKIERLDVVALLNNKSTLDEELAYLEKLQEKFNADTKLTFKNKSYSLSELIKFYGMKTKNLSLLEIVISSEVDLPAYKRNLTKDSRTEPYFKCSSTKSSMMECKHQLESEISKIKGLIAQGNMQIVQE